MDKGADGAVVGVENISGDQIGSNSGGIATTTRLCLGKVCLDVQCPYILQDFYD